MARSAEEPVVDSGAPGRTAAPARAVAVLAAGVGAVGWAAIFVRLADEAPPLTEAAYRMALGASVLIAYTGLQVWRGRARLPGKGDWPLLALSGVLLAGHFWSWFASLGQTSVGSSVVIVRCNRCSRVP